MRLRTGTDFPIYVDKESLGWGEDWEQSIRDALLSTTFLIPILTPSYFLSEQCRSELLTFVAEATALGLEELILPIYYVDVPGLNAPKGASDDEVLELVKRYQWADWRSVELEGVESSVYRKAVDQLAQQLLDRIESADSKPEESPRPPKKSDGEAASTVGPTDEAEIAEEPPGVLDELAEAEESFERIVSEIEEIGGIIDEVGHASSEATASLESNPEASFAERLEITRELGQRLEAPGVRLENLTKSFLEDLVRIDPMMVFVFHAIREGQAEPSHAAEQLRLIDVMANQANQGLGSAEELAKSMEGVGGISKELRKPVRRISTALRQLADARGTFRRWQSEAMRIQQTTLKPARKSRRQGTKDGGV